ncbi:hypothetical protein LCGC14_2739360, partial [marine sediment metagenome]
MLRPAKAQAAEKRARLFAQAAEVLPTDVEQSAFFVPGRVEVLLKNAVVLSVMLPAVSPVSRRVVSFLSRCEICLPAIAVRRRVTALRLITSVFCSR